MNKSKYKRLVVEKEIANGIVDVSKRVVKNYYELHWHDFFEITYYYEGRGQNVINGKKYDICPGKAVMLTPSDYHEIIVEEPITEITLMINPNVITDEMTGNAIPLDQAVCCSFSDESKRNMESLLEMILKEFKFNSKYSMSCQRNLVGLIVSNFFRQHEAENITEESPKYAVSINNEKLFKRAMAYILTNFKSNPGLSEISEYLGYSPSYFSRHFHEISGVSYKEYLRKLRLNHAKKLLVSSDMSVAEVATNSGYSTLQVFLADFKKVYGETPTTFRRQHLGK